jgi:hypothetical protein
VGRPVQVARCSRNLLVTPGTASGRRRIFVSTLIASGPDFTQRLRTWSDNKQKPRHAGGVRVP